MPQAGEHLMVLPRLPFYKGAVRGKIVSTLDFLCPAR